jgi:hypothetical protein
MGCLRWEKQTGGVDAELGYSGDICIGMIVKRSTDGVIVWSAHEGVRMKWTAKGNGEARDFPSARRAVERSWKRWLERANLQPVSPQP